MIGLLRKELAGLQAYQPEPALGDAALDANESPFPPPASFLRDASALLEQAALNRYPDPSCAGLLQAAAGYYGVKPAQLLPGNGSDELIVLLLSAFGSQGRRCLVPTPTFSIYALAAKAQGWEVTQEPLDEAFQLTPSFLERAREEKPTLVFLASPNNPTGNCFDVGMIEALLELPLVLVLDEAYAEFAPASFMHQVGRRGNLVVLRTLSKAFGLAGLRLGFLAGDEDLTAELNKIRLPYNVGVLAQALGALALNRAKEFEGNRRRILELKPRLEAALKALPGNKVYPSDANFFLFRPPDAAGLHARLLKAGLRLRRFSGGRLDGCLRVSVGDEEQMQRLEKELKP